MLISTEIESAKTLVGYEKAVEYIAKAGFDAWDFSLFDMCSCDWSKKIYSGNSDTLSNGDSIKLAKELKHIGIENGIHCNQSHAPFPCYHPQVITYLKKSIECTAEAGGNICIIHPDNLKSAEENAEMYFELLTFAKQYGVKIATENMYTWNADKDCAGFAACATPEDFLAHLNAVNDDFFVACLDVGHAEMRGANTSAVKMIKALDNKLQALHLHDNDLHKDSHQIPFSMNIDFQPIIKALREIDYKGYFTLEATSYLNEYDKTNVLSGLKKMANAAKMLSDMYENEC